MATVLSEETTTTDAANDGCGGNEVVLSDGSRRTLAGLGRDELFALQWEQERDFARRILAATKCSPARAEVLRQAYDTVPRINAAARGNAGQAPLMGVHPRYERLVVELLRRQRQRGLSARLFEIGFGAGRLLKAVCDAGFPFAGIEASPSLQAEARHFLGPEHAAAVRVGDFLQDEIAVGGGPPSLVYWNDVLEHIPPDEIGDWLRRIYRLLPSGGQLVTVTPNWHVRPSSVTGVFCPPRTESTGLHFKEYTLGEIYAMLRRAGFAHVAVPLLAMPRKYVLWGCGLIGLKRAWEPALESLPFPAARRLCNGLALSCTIATKSER